MTKDTVQFINNLSANASQAATEPAHAHERGGPTHSHDGPGDHGHTHEHLDHAGEFVYPLQASVPLLMSVLFNGGGRQVRGARYARLRSPELRGAWFHHRHWRVREISILLRFQTVSTRVPPRALTTCTAFDSRPVGSGKTALTLALCQKLRAAYNIGAVLTTPLPSLLSSSGSGMMLIVPPGAPSDCHERHLHEGGPGVSN